MCLIAGTKRPVGVAKTSQIFADQKVAQVASCIKEAKWARDIAFFDQRFASAALKVVALQHLTG